jgi:hypothetical protein
VVLVPWSSCGCGGESQAAASGGGAANDEARRHWIHQKAKMFKKIYANNWKFDLSLEEPPGEQPLAKSDL